MDENRPALKLKYRLNCRLFGNEGQTLISVLIGAAVMIVSMLAFMGMMSAQQKEIRAMSEKLAALDLERLMIAAFSDPAICTAELSNSALNASAPYVVNVGSLSNYVINLNSIHSNAAPASPVLISAGALVTPTSSLKVSTIKVKNFTSNSGTGTNYLAEIEISFDPASLVRSIKPITLKVSITTDATQKITTCMGSFGASSTTEVITIYQCPNVPNATLLNPSNGYVNVTLIQTGPLITSVSGCQGGSTEVGALVTPCSGQLSTHSICQAVGIAGNALANTSTSRYCSIACTALGKLAN
jgi:hypothetical protein